jgi:hypothetical protein
VRELPAGHGIGLAHAYSGTMALDIDDWIPAQLALSGIVDLAELYDAPDAVIIDSGRSGRGKLLFSLPAPMQTKRVTEHGKTLYELRCATAGGLTVQDVLPPSIHPDTGAPYRWAGRGHWSRLPAIPDALLKHWQTMLDKDTTRDISMQTTAGAASAIASVSWSEIQQAIEVIPASVGREQWVQVGMALHYAGALTKQSDTAYTIWRDWSMGSPDKYPGDTALAVQWRSFDAGKSTAVKLGTLFKIAADHGYTRQIDASALFSAITAANPSSIITESKPTPPDLDLSLLPDVLAMRAGEVSRSVGCDPLVPAWAGLAAVCGVIDSRSRLELMPGFRVPPVLWLMTIGDPADKKSPGSRPMMFALKDIEAEQKPAYAKSLLEWEGKEAAYSASKKAFLEWSASAEAMLGGDAPNVSELPPMPVPPKITVSDITSQKLVRACADRPRGMLCYLDEMNGWVKKLTDKSSGEDRSAWVVAYESESYEMDRVGTGSTHCDNLAVSIYGNIQPQVYRDSMASLSSDGLLQRFLPAILRSDKTKMGQPIPDALTSQSAWDTTLRVTYSLPPTIYKLSPDAYKSYREFQTWYESAKQDERLLQASTAYMTAFGKLEGLVGRLALVFHVINNPFAVTVGADTISKVVALVKSYIIPAYRYSLDVLADHTSLDTWLHEYILQHSDVETITLQEIKRTCRRKLESMSTWQADNAIYASMSAIERAGWVARLDDGLLESRSVAKWAINPDIHVQYADHRRQVIEAKQRRVDALYRNAGCKDKIPKTHGNE